MCNFLPKIKVFVGLFLGLLVSFSKTSFSIKNFGLKKNFRYQSQKCWPQNKVSESVLMKISVSSLSSSQPRGRRRSSIQQINRSCNQPTTHPCLANLQNRFLLRTAEAVCETFQKYSKYHCQVFLCLHETSLN